MCVRVCVCVCVYAYVEIHVNCSIVQSTTHHSNVKDCTMQSFLLEDYAVGVGLFITWWVIMTIVGTYSIAHLNIPLEDM